MIKTLQALFYITWIIVGIMIIVGVFVGITTFPFEKVGGLLQGGPNIEREDMETPSVGPPGSSGPSPEMQQGGSSEIDQGSREMLSRVLGKERTAQIKTWDDITSEEKAKLENEKYFGESPPGQWKAP